MSEKNIEIREGQLWKFNDKESTLIDANIIIRKIELMISTDHKAHISVQNLKIGNEYFDIDHLPIKLNLLINSLEEMMLIEDDLSEIDQSSFLEGYKYWKEANGGVWNVSLKDAIMKTITVADENV